MRVTALWMSLMLCATALLADEHSVDFDQHTNFSTLKTFAVREGKINSPRPELNNAIVGKKIADAIRAELKAKGLKETVGSPDILVDFSITGEDYSETRGGPAAFSQGTLVIDLVKRDANSLIWRSVFRNNEKNNSRLAQKLPEDVKKSFAAYPPKKQAVIEPEPAAQVVVRDITPKAAAAVALEIIQATRQNTAFVGGSAHPGLAVSLNNLERTAQAVVEDDGTGPARTEGRISAFMKAMRDTIDFANSIADRRADSSDSRARSRELADKLRSLLGP